MGKHKHFIHGIRYRDWQKVGAKSITVSDTVIDFAPTFAFKPLEGKISLLWLKVYAKILPIHEQN